MVDEQGNYLENRGIKIAQFGELPLPNSQHSSTVIDDRAAPLDETLTENAKEAVPSPTPITTNDEQQPSVQPGQLVLTLRENLIPSLSLLPSCADHPLAQSLHLPLTQLLTSDRYTHLLTGLMAVTGLKAGELLKSKKFYPYPDLAFALLFSSTVTTSYDRLVTLVEAVAVRDAIARLRTHPDVQPLLYLSPNDIDSHCLPHITKTLSSYLPFKDIEEMVATYQSCVGTDEPPHESEKQKRPQTTIYNVYTDDRSRLETLADSLGLGGTQAAIFHALLNWVEGHLKKEEATPVDVQPHESLQAITEQAKTLSWLTNEITSLRERVTTLEQERDGLKSQLEQASTPDPQMVTMIAENDRLRSEFDKANSTLKVFRQLLNGDDERTDRPPEVKSNTPKSTVVTEPKISLPSQSVESSPTHVKRAIVTPSPHQKKHRRPRSSGGARQRAISIWNALQQWNQLHPDNTFALTPALLEITFHIHRAAAHQFIDEYKTQIDEHHM